jgi:hypothetical protein
MHSSEWLNSGGISIFTFGGESIQIASRRQENQQEEDRYSTAGAQPTQQQIVTHFAPP